MGFVEVALELVSVRSTLVFIILASVLWAVIVRIDEHRRITRMGAYGQSLKYYLPFGFDFVVKSVKSTINHGNLEFWNNVIFPSSSSGRWTSETRILGQRLVLTADPENMKAMLATQFADYGKGKPFHEEWDVFLGDSIFTTDGQLWRDSRQLIRPQFTRDRVSDLHCFESHFQTLFKTIANGGPLDGEDQPVDLAAANGRRVDIRDLFFRYTLDVATEFLLGGDVKSLSTHKQDFADAFNDVQRIQNVKVRSGKFQHLMPMGAFNKGMKVINHFIHTFIDRALRLSPQELLEKNKSDKDYNFLHALAGYTREPKVLRDQIIGVLLAGRDTTASTLSWTIYELGRHPEVVAKLRKEILETVGPNHTPSYEHLKNMTYLKNILNEVLRLYPVVPFNVRLALKDTTLPFGGGPDGLDPLPVLKDTPIAYSTLVMQRRVDLYPPVSDTFPHPHVFSPERWSVWHPKPHEYIPFNAGPRICIGQQFALAEMSYTLVRLFQHFDHVQSFMHEIDGGNPILKADIVLSPGQGVHVAFWEPEEKEV